MYYNDFQQSYGYSFPKLWVLPSERKPVAFTVGWWQLTAVGAAATDFVVVWKATAGVVAAEAAEAAAATAENGGDGGEVLASEAGLVASTTISTKLGRRSRLRASESAILSSRLLGTKYYGSTLGVEG